MNLIATALLIWKFNMSIYRIKSKKSNFDRKWTDLHWTCVCCEWTSLIIKPWIFVKSRGHSITHRFILCDRFPEQGKLDLCSDYKINLPHDIPWNVEIKKKEEFFVYSNYFRLDEFCNLTAQMRKKNIFYSYFHPDPDRLPLQVDFWHFLLFLTCRCHLRFHLGCK